MPSALVVLLATVVVARAHPFDASFYGHQLEVALEDGELRVAYLVEVPTVDALADLQLFLQDVDSPGAAHQAAYTARVLDELEDGLQVRLDGERIALARKESAAPSGVGDRRFITFRLQLEGAVHPDARTLHVVNANFPGERALFSRQAWVDDTIRVHDTDLVALQDGRVVRDDSGRWLGGEKNRELRISLSRRGSFAGALRRQRRYLVEPDALRLRPAREALVTDPVGLVRQSLASGGLGAGPIAAAAVSGVSETGPAAVAVGIGVGALGLGGLALTGGLCLGFLLLGAAGAVGLPAALPGGVALVLALGAAVSARRHARTAQWLGAACLATLPGLTAQSCAAEALVRGPWLGMLLAAVAWASGAALCGLGWAFGRTLDRAGIPAAMPALVIGAVLSGVLGSIYWGA
ncbi:MAG: hypothetical protein VX000_00380 [Myxococcota bacterium]|nr:hypothetical protein [Myxococcota bacterium]